uniref:Serine aminopeptidase S33 domain-containing protein n=1 Tax=Chenopodium quinoa TaxID=63459 RepID=A0A803KPJ1_CHEQI
MASILAFRVFPSFRKKLGHRPGFGGRVVCNLGGENSTVLHSDSVSVKGESVIKETEKIGSSIAGGNGHVGSIGGGKKRGKEVDSEELEVLWDDGYGSASMKDYLDIAKEMIKPDGGPPRWFSPVECGRPLKGSPLLLFLPGMDGVGLGLIMHHKALGKVFEVQCLHIPVNDRTPFEGLVDFVERVVREKHASSPNKPIYLVGDSFGGSLALAVAARNPMVDLVLILANPATSLERGQLKPFFPILEALPDELHNTVPYLLSFVMGEPVKMAMVNVDKKLPPSPMLRQLSKNLTDLLPRLSVISDLIPKDALLWKLKLLKSAAAYANSRLHAVKAEVLVLASLKDNMLPSEDEAKRLSGLLKNCKVRTFKENGHTLLLEDGINLLTVIKATGKYRRSRRMDYITDFVPPSFSEFKTGFDQYSGWLNYYTSPVLFSTLEDGKIVQGLSGVPSEGPVIYVGYHMLMGLEISGLAEGFLREKKILVRGLAHPALFGSNSSNNELSYFDYIKVFGAVPVTASNFFKLLSTKSHILLYPGGAREALHYRLVLDYNDLMKIPVLNERVRQSADESGRVRNGDEGEVANENLFFPGLLPKIPGRFYYLFGKPIETQGREELLSDKKSAEELYSQIKSEVSSNIDYLLKKREDDPYRNIIDRTIYRLASTPAKDVPSFTP